MKTVVFVLPAAKSLKKLPADIRARIMDKLARYAETGAGDVKTLKGRDDARLRVGDFRITFVETTTTITVTEVGDRRDIYR